MMRGGVFYLSPVITGLGTVLTGNPFRYRGYYYDSSTNLYYLNSRYYDPAIGRFINPDNPENLYETGDTTFGANLFTYALNNPVMYYDPTGEIAWFILIPLLALSIASTGYTVYNVITDPSLENFGWLALDIALTVVPFVSSAMIKGGVHAASATDKLLDAAKAVGITVQRANKADFTKDAYNLVRGVSRPGGFTKSSARIGTQIHKGFMKGHRLGSNVARIDGIAGRTIFELKPNNIRSIKQGIKQLQRYQNSLFNATGVRHNMVLVLY